MPYIQKLDLDKKKREILNLLRQEGNESKSMILLSHPHNMLPILKLLQ